MPGLRHRAPGKLGHDAGPERDRTLVSLRDADDPFAGEAVPEKPCRSTTDAKAPIAASDEELGDVEDVRIVRGRGPPRRKRESGDATVALQEKGESPVGLRPVQRQLAVPEAPIRSELDRK